MKTTMLFASLLLVVPTAFAQRLPARPSPVPSAPLEHNYSSSSYGSNSLITGSLGFVKSAFNFGASFEKVSSSLGLGGYFFYQSDKEVDSVKVVYQTISFGGFAKFYVMENSRYNVYVGPGFGLHMLKDLPDKTGKTDKTLIGPVVKIGATMKLSPTMAVGLERMDLANWFESFGNAPADSQSYSAILAIEI